MLGRLTKAGLLLVAVFATVWLLVIFYWQSADRVPSAVDVGLGLFALPASLVLSVVALRALLRRRGASPLVDANPSAAHGARTAVAAGDAEVLPAFRLAVLVGSVRTSYGASVADLASALVQGKRPELDPELKTGAGFPVPAGRIPELDGDMLREQLTVLPMARSDEIDIDHLSDDYLRALQLLSEVQSDLLTHAAQMPSPAGTERGVSLIPPASWRDNEMQLAIQWLKHLAVQAAPGSEWRFDLSRPSAVADTWTVLEKVTATLTSNATRPALWLVVSGESFISQACVARWEAEGRLHTGGQGLIPGEAAAGLLLTSATDAAHVAPDAALLSSPVRGRLDESADARQVSRATTLAALTDQLLDAAKAQAEAIQWVVSDADHRGNRVTEVAKLLNDKLPHVPFDSNNFSVGASCGQTGAAGTLLSLALGCHLAQQDRQQVLVASVIDAHARAAALVNAPPAA